MNILKKLHLPAIVGALSSLVGLANLAARPDIAPVLPHVMPDEYAAVLVAAGVLIQAVTRAVHKGDVVEVSKPGY